MKRRHVWIALLVLWSLSGCGPGAPQLPNSPVSTVATARRNATAAPLAAFTPGQRFAITGRALSTDDTLSRIALELRGARVAPEGLVLRVAFANTLDESFQLVGTLGGSDAVLVDGTGREYAPVTVAPALSSISPENGFTPGAANVGDLTFPLPGAGPYELRFPIYTPIVFQLDTPLADVPEQALTPGIYSLDATVRSQRDGLRPIELQLRTLEVRDDVLIFEIAFTNTGRQGYDLVVGPSGSDARLIDAEGQVFVPSQVSDTLAASIAPVDGWLPQQANSGTITFPRPQRGEQLRFVFPEYDALTVQIDQAGALATTVTSASGGAPAPTTVPSAEEQTLAEIDVLLARQTAAVHAGDVPAFIDTFAPALRSEQELIGQRLTQLPFASYLVQLASNAAPAAGDSLVNVPVEIRYTLRGIDPNNVFQHNLRYDLARAADGWQVINVVSEATPPFWWSGDVTVTETPHFLIIARPEAQAVLPTLEQEAKQAYAALQAKGLPLAERSVVYFAATQQDFANLTGRGARFLGLALSRYEFRNDAIITTNQAFYLNGASFAEADSTLAPDERQTTITHELVHLALASETRPFTPLWLVEGAAVFFSEETGGVMRQRLIEDGVLASISLAGLTEADALGKIDLDGERASYEYAYAGETFAYLTETFGEAHTLEFYRAYAAVPARDVLDQLPDAEGNLSPGAFSALGRSLTEQLVTKYFGVSLDQLDAAVKVWLDAGE